MNDERYVCPLCDYAYSDDWSSTDMAHDDLCCGVVGNRCAFIECHVCTIHRDTERIRALTRQSLQRHGDPSIIA